MDRTGGHTAKIASLYAAVAPAYREMVSRYHWTQRIHHLKNESSLGSGGTGDTVVSPRQLDSDGRGQGSRFRRIGSCTSVLCVYRIIVLLSVGESVHCMSNAGPWLALFASKHVQPLRLCQLLVALVINALLLWSYHATPDLLPYTEEAINNGSDPILPWDVAWSTEYTFNTRRADVAVRVLGALLAAVGVMFVYLKLTNATVMILPNRCVCRCHATVGFAGSSSGSRVRALG